VKYEVGDNFGKVLLNWHINGPKADTTKNENRKDNYESRRENNLSLEKHDMWVPERAGAQNNLISGTYIRRP
jgi:hypothetical protein